MTKDSWLSFSLEVYHPYVAAIGILVATVIVALAFNRFMVRYIKRSSEELVNDPTNYQFLRRAILVLLYMVGISLAIYAIPPLRTLAQSVLAGAGILAIAIGFASQAAFSNIVAGIFIVIFKPFRVHDRIEIENSITGVVEDITLRHTIIRNFENRRVIIPNSKISEQNIINSDLIESKICKWIEIGISYDSDIKLAKKIMVEETEKHPLALDPRSKEDIENGAPRVNVRVLQLGDFSVLLRAWAWAANSPDGFELKCDLLESIKARFDAEGIEIPFPYRTLVFKNSPNSPD